MRLLNANNLEALVGNAVLELDAISDERLDSASSREEGASRDECLRLDNHATRC